MRVRAEADHAAELRAAARDVLAAAQRLADVRGLRDARLVDLDELAEVAGGLEHRVELEVDARAAHVPEDEHLRVLQDVDVHLGVLRARGLVAEVGAVDARDHVVAGVEALLLQGGLAARLLGDVLVHRDVPAKEVTLGVDDVGLAAVQEAHAHPLARPDGRVDEELEVLQGLLVEEHAREMVRDAQELEVLGGRGAHVLLHGRVGVAREERVRVHVAGDANHG